MLKRLLDDLGQLLRESNGPITVVFQGGGSLVLPPWFLDELRRLGVAVLLVDAAGVEVLTRGDTGPAPWCGELERIFGGERHG
jgi:hypothetical protein